MPKLIPTTVWNSLSLAIARGDAPRAQEIVEDHRLDVNACVDSSAWMPVLMEALLSYGFATEDDRLPLLHYLLDEGANPNIICARGYNCLHIAAQQEKYIHALDLFLDYDADVNIGDADGSNIVYWAVQGWLLRREGADRATYLRVLDKILHLGADLDQENRFGMNTRKWLQLASPDVQELVQRWEAAKPVIHDVTTVQPVFPNLRYPELVRHIWDQFVPADGGPADTVQGELLRTVENLRDEARRIANSHQHATTTLQAVAGATHRRVQKRQAIFVRDTLLRSGVFDKTESHRIRTETQRLIKHSRDYPSDEVYDDLVDMICVFYTRNPTPIPL
ncbi:ankyrin repeat domain-containing protein [Puia dinghuensis]|uniref:ankyrin repeat domain-containing protein n=1 Tax=Puia dinghuensis TaxID=1792502 RepID=UPI00166434A8|nr:ankyrin repeat domain-containing protein [Puia dinghuensis]